MRAIPIVLVCSLTALSACGDARQPTSPVAATPSSDRRSASGEFEREAVLSASGRYQVTVPPDVFGTHTAVIARFRFSVRKEDDGSVSGHFSYYQAVDGAANSYEGSFTCFNTYDFDGGIGNRAKVGGRVEESTNPNVPAGSFLWWQAIDNGDHSPPIPSKSTLAGAGDAAANAAFCASSNPPRFGPFAVDGRLEVSASEERSR